MKKTTPIHFEKLNKRCLLIAIVHWFITLFTDRLIFAYVTFDFSNLTQTIKTAVTISAKAVFLLVLIAVWQGIYFLIKKADRKYVKYACIYFVINMLLLFLIWPGIWRMDEFGILNSAVLLFPVFWQSYLTSVFYIFSLMLIPVPSGVIIMQCICISLLAGFIVLWFEKQFGKWGLLSYIPLLFLPVLDSNLYPMRMSLYAFLELFLLLYLYDIWKRKKEFARSEKVVLILLAAVVTVWRTEAIYYLVLFPILLCILFAKKWDKKVLMQTICFYLVASIVLFVPQKVGDKLTSGNQYDLTSVVLPLVPLVERAYCEDADQKELQAIDQVINVEVTVEGAKAGKSGINLFWGNPDFQRPGYTDADYDAFKKAYYQLIVKYTDTFLKERWTCFIESEDLLENTTALFTKEDVPNYETFKQYPLSNPIHNATRTHVISFLECRSQSDYMEELKFYHICYSPLIPIAILLLGWAFCLCRKRWSEFFILSLPLVKIPLIFLTAPSRLFMYYYSLYLIGYFVLFLVLLSFVAKVWKKAGPAVLKTIRYAKRNGIKAAYYAVRERIDHKHVDAMTKKAQAYEGNKEWGSASNKDHTEAFENSFSYVPKVSIVVPTYETKEVFLRELLDCVINQIYSDWELVIADASKTNAVKDVIEDVKANQSFSEKIVYKKLDANKGISDNTNVAIEMATGDYIALLDHDDLLTCDALYEMVACLNKVSEVHRESVIAVYSDEDKCDGDATRFYEPNFKPDFNLDFLLSNNYICHFLMVRADVMKELKLRAKYDGAQDYDLILRLASKNKQILHVDKVLYHWRCHEESTAANTDSKRYAYDAGREALKDYYDRAGLSDSVKVSDSDHLGFYLTEYVPDIFAVRNDVAAICGRVIKKGIVVASPDEMFDGIYQYSSGYMHRADLYYDVTSCDERAVRLRDNLNMDLAEALDKGMKLVYDPNFVVEI